MACDVEGIDVGEDVKNEAGDSKKVNVLSFVNSTALDVNSTVVFSGLDSWKEMVSFTANVSVVLSI